MLRRGLGLGSLLLVLAAVATSGENLARTYKPRIDHDPDAPGRSWDCGPEDVWRLKSFKHRSKELRIETGPATLVVGHHATSAVWAVLIPDAPGKVVSIPSGEQAVASIWLRFNPAVISRLFPASVVEGRGPALAVIPALRVYQYKINGCMQIENTPFVGKKEFVIFDVDTPTGQRHWYSVDTTKGSLNYENAFLNRPVPPAPAGAITEKDALAAFDGAWKAFDEKYAMFGLRKELDWEELRETYRPLAAKADTVYEAAGVISMLVRPLRDLHVWVKAGDESLPGYYRCRVLNANWDLTKAHVALAHEDQDVTWGRTPDGIGYINVWRLASAAALTRFDQALEQLGPTWGMILDLRFNGGGDEGLALKMAGRFLDRERVYSLNRYRSGYEHDMLGSKLERKCEPRGPWTYRAPVMVLIGQKTMSSAESFALMMARCPRVTTIGDRTAGSSGNPRVVKLAAGISVNVPTWIDLDPKGKPIDEVGVQPDVKVEAVPSAFRNGDPVMAEALSRLRAIAKAKRRPGKAD